MRIHATLWGLVPAGAVPAQPCSGTITADEAMKAETARYAAQTSNDFAAMETMFGNDLTSRRDAAREVGRLGARTAPRRRPSQAGPAHHRHSDA